ncbi:hypothetical protein Pyn_04200 [Prunus yedoensis var. nudiflora]|uniref:Uncharacterized protein n=1 Tax=Prunus yedoensis var. nudiflora TaxID=2094558 RepID=A0A314ZUY3_PRUYE|nr:hypothetical protein Pyn_04200 [Prunus yedoensis var. nudiflora]
MLVSDKGSNQPVVHADIKAKQTYFFPRLDSPQIRPSAFVTHDHSDRHDNKGNASARKNEMPTSIPSFGMRHKKQRHKKQSTVPMMKLQPPRRKPKKRLKTLVHQTLEPRCWNRRLGSSEFAASSWMHDSNCMNPK